MKRIDFRVPRTPGDTVTIDGADYTIGSECFRGGTALCYSASCDGQTEHYVIKEIYPPAGAGRNKDGDVYSTSGNSYEMCLQSFQNELILMESASSDTFQSWHYERFDIGRGIGVMRMNAKDTQRLDKAITKYAGDNHTPMERLGWALRITRSLLTGLHKIHTNARLLHLDLSLTNIFLSQDGNGPNAFFLDFGEARQLNDLNVCPADSGSTSPFGAPERFSRATRTLTSAADTFSAAVLFYHILTTGSWAYQNQSIPDAAMLSKWDCAEVKYGLGCLDLPTGTENAVFLFMKKGMAYRSDKRFQTAAEMLEQVERLIHIVDQKGIYRELILNQSIELYQKTVFYKIAPELEPQLPEPKSQHVLFLGDGGGGKTTHLFSHWAKCLQACKEDFTQPVPIYISVSSFKGVEYQGNFILDEILDIYVNRWEGCREDGRAELRELLRSSQYLLLLDGFNTSIQPDGLYKELSKLTEYPLLRIYAASRIPFEGRAMDCFQQIPVASLTTQQVQHALAKAGRPTLAPGRLLETLQRPMFLSLYLRINPKQEDEISTPGEILGRYWQHLLDQFREGNHLNRNTALWDYALNTAFPLLASKTDSLHFQSNQIDGTEYAVGDILHVLKNCGLVRLIRAFRTKPHQWAFTHQIYQDFGQAMQVGYELDEWENGDEARSDKILPSGPVEPEVLSLLANIWREHLPDEGGELSIQRWMQKHLAGKQGAGPQMVVRNLLEARKTAHDIFLPGCYDGLDLRLTNFYGKSLVDSTFRKAVLSENTFFSPGHRHRITAIAYHKKRQWIATASQDEHQIILWDRRTQSHVRTIETTGNVIALEVSEKTDQLAWICRDLDEVAVYDLRKGEQRNLSLIPQHLWMLYHIGTGCVLHFDGMSTTLYYTCAGYGQISWDLSIPFGEPGSMHIQPLPVKDNAIVISVHGHQGRIEPGYLDFCNRNGRYVSLWDPTGRELHKLDLEQSLRTFSISPDKRYFSCIVEDPEGKDEGRLCLYDLTENCPNPKLLGTVSIRAGIAATDAYLLVGSTDIIDERAANGIREIPGGIWELKSGRKLPNTEKFYFDAAAVMSPEELAVGSGSTARILDADTGKCKCEFVGHGVVNYSANIWFLPGENTFCRAFRDGTVAKFSLDDRSCEKIIDGRSLKDGTSVPDADGHWIITVSKDGLLIHSAHNGEQIHHIEGNFFGFDRFTLLETGNILVGESNDHSDILLWDIHGQTATVVCGAGFWAEVLELDVPSRYRKQIRISVNRGEPVTRPIHACDYPPRQRKEFILERNALARQEKTCRDDFGDPSLALLLVKERTPRTMTYVRDVHKILPGQNLLISGHYDGTVSLWAITPDKIEKRREKKLCSEPIEQIELIPDFDGFLVVSRSERVYMCRILDNTVDLFTFWDASPYSLHIPGVSEEQFPPYRYLAELKPISKDMSYLTYRNRRIGGVLINHFSGKIIQTGISEEYDFNTSRWLLRSRNSDTWVIWDQPRFGPYRFSVNNTADGTLRLEGRLTLLLTFAASAVSDDGNHLVAASTNGDIQVFDTIDGSTFLWPKADTLDLCSCDFSQAVMDDRLRELLRMNGGIC